MLLTDNYLDEQLMVERYLKDDAEKFLWNKCLIGLAFVSPKGEWLRVNPRLCEILEYTESELMHMKFQDVTHPADLKDDKNMVEKILAGAIDDYLMSKRYITKTGKIVWIKLKVNAVRDNKTGCVMHFLSQISNPIELDRFPKYLEPQDFGIKEKKGKGAFTLRKFVQAGKDITWIIVTIVGVLALGFNQYYQYRKAQEERIESQKIILEMQGKIDRLSNP